jgi:hypothetical protein
VLYNSVMFLFATPFGRPLLLDVAMPALAAWSVGMLRQPSASSAV